MKIENNPIAESIWWLKKNVIAGSRMPESELELVPLKELNFGGIVAPKWIK